MSAKDRRSQPMSDKPGFSYQVSDEQLRAFRSRTPSERLRWLEELREATFKLASPTVRARWQRLRRGDPED